MRSATILALLLPAVCCACGAKSVTLGDDPRASVQGNDRSDSGSSTPAHSSGGSAAGAGGGTGPGVAGSSGSAGRATGSVGGGGGSVGGATGVAGSGGSNAGGAGSQGLGGYAKTKYEQTGGAESVGTGGRPINYPLGDPTPEPLPPREAGVDLSTTLDALLESATKANQRFCACMWPTIPPESSDCSYTVYFGWSLYASPRPTSNCPPPIFQCIKKVLTATPVGDAGVKCEGEALEDLVNCVTTTSCDAISQCFEAFSHKRLLCPLAPYDLDAKIHKDCWGYAIPAPMTCRDGVRIDSTLVCNQKADCSQGEDESPEYCGN